MQTAKKYYTVLLVTGNVVPSSQLVVTLMIEVLHSSETPVFTRAAWRRDGIFQ
jgi:hypothetical protein